MSTHGSDALSIRSNSSDPLQSFSETCVQSVCRQDSTRPTGHGHVRTSSGPRVHNLYRSKVGEIFEPSLGHVISFSWPSDFDRTVFAKRTRKQHRPEPKQEGDAAALPLALLPPRPCHPSTPPSHAAPPWPRRPSPLLSPEPRSCAARTAVAAASSRLR